MRTGLWNWWLDETSFEACLKSDRFADVVSSNLRLAEELGINGTPTIMVSRGRGMARRLPGYDSQSIAAVVDEMLAELQAEAPNAPSGGN